MVFKFKRITSEAPFPFYRVRALDCEPFAAPEAGSSEVPVVMLKFFANTRLSRYRSIQFPAETPSVPDLPPLAMLTVGR